MSMNLARVNEFGDSRLGGRVALPVDHRDLGSCAIDHRFRRRHVTQSQTGAQQL